jgi:hypothetical protein
MMCLQVLQIIYLFELCRTKNMAVFALVFSNSLLVFYFAYYVKIIPEIIGK